MLLLLKWGDTDTGCCLSWGGPPWLGGLGETHSEDILATSNRLADPRPAGQLGAGGVCDLWSGGSGRRRRRARDAHGRALTEGKGLPEQDGREPQVARTDIPQPSPELGFTPVAMKMAPPGSRGLGACLLSEKHPQLQRGSRVRPNWGCLDRPPPPPTAQASTCPPQRRHQGREAFARG